MKILFLVALFCSFFSKTTLAAPEPKEDWVFTDVKSLPIQAGGRVKPLESLAREVVLFVTGSSKYGNWDATELLFSWVAEPEAWSREKVIRVGNPDVRKQILMESDRTMFSPQELLSNTTLIQYAQSMGPKGQSSLSVVPQSRADPREQEFRRVLDRISLFRQLLSGEGFRPFPNKDSTQPWGSVAEKDAKSPLQAGWLALFSAYAKGERETFQSTAVRLLEDTQKEMKEVLGADEAKATEKRIFAEHLYNLYRPFTIAMFLYFCVVLLIVLKKKPLLKPALGLFVLALLSHITGFTLRVIVSGRPPVTNMYESLVWVSFGAVFFGSILYAFQRRPFILGSACAIAGFGLMTATVSPSIMDPGIHPLVPVLRSNYWLTIHVLTITLGYAAFALSLGISNVMLWHSLKGSSLLVLEGLNQNAYRAVQIGVVFLAAGTILGGVWADASWGRFWGWDPKEVWALIALLAYVAILHARFVGWVGVFGFSACCVVAFLCVVMAWYGVNFVLGAGLHSYGFGGGGLPWVVAFCSLQLGFLALVAALRKRNSIQRRIDPGPNLT